MDCGNVNCLVLVNYSANVPLIVLHLNSSRSLTGSFNNEIFEILNVILKKGSLFVVYKYVYVLFKLPLILLNILFDNSDLKDNLVHFMFLNIILAFRLIKCLWKFVAEPFNVFFMCSSCFILNIVFKFKTLTAVFGRPLGPQAY